jgi:hypothetical protein
MDYLIPLGCAALLVGFALYVGLPLLNAQLRVQMPSSGAPTQQLQERKEQLYATIKELELDRDLGKLHEEDYQKLRRDLESQALDLLQQLDQLNGHTHAETLRTRIEEDISKLRGQPNSGVQCSSCEAFPRPGDQFCSQCGAPFGEAE